MKMIINLLPFLYMDNMHLQSNNKILICLILFVLKEFVTACTPVVTKSSSTVLILIYDEAYQMNHKLFKKMK